MIKPPERIWLQWYGDNPEGEVNEDDVSWSREKIFEEDIVYVRDWKLRCWEKCHRVSKVRHRCFLMVGHQGRHLFKCDLENRRRIDWGV